MNQPNEIIWAFTDEQAARLTGLSIQQLRNWDRSGFFEPSFAADNRRSPFSRVYSFADLLSLKILKRLRIDLKCSLQHLRQVKLELEALGEVDWHNKIMAVLQKKVVFYDDQSGDYFEPVSNQKVFKIPLHVVQSDMKAAVSDLWKRSPEDVGRFEKHRRIVHNSEVMGGTRIPVRSIIDFIDAGYSNSEIIEEFPTLRVRTHNQKMTIAAMQIADKNSSPHRS